MSDKREFYAPTVDDAVDKACAALGLGREQLEFEILDQGSTGFLGIGTRDARIAVKYPVLPMSSAAGDYEDRLPRADNKDNVSTAEEPVRAARVIGQQGSSNDNVPYDLIVAVDEFMIKLIEAMGLDATIDVYDAGEILSVNVTTKETGLFIGQKGETIESVQYLLNLAIYRDRPFFKRIVIDSEGYRQRRVEAIQGMAHRTARRVLREKRPLSLPPMSAAERRVVHLFLKDNPSVTTCSEGQDDKRRVVVSPV